MLMLFVTARKRLEKQLFFVSDSYKDAHKALNLFPAVTAVCDLFTRRHHSLQRPPFELNEKKRAFGSISSSDLQQGRQSAHTEH